VECRRRFEEISGRVSSLHAFISKNRREDWPASFYRYLLKTLPFVSSDETAVQIAKRIINYIETNQEKIETTLNGLADQPFSYDTLHSRFGEFTLPIAKFYGGYRGIKSKQRGGFRERLTLDLPFAVLAGETFTDKITPSPLEAALVKEEQRQLAALREALTELPTTDQAIVQRIFFEDENPKLVADSLGISARNFQHRLDRLYATLRELID